MSPPRVAIATCAAFPLLFEDDRPLLAALERHGVAAEPCVWNADVEWGRFDAVLIRSVWDYFLHVEAFRAWLDRLDREGVPCWNETSLVRWNLHKRYLRELEAQGIPVAPTVALDSEEAATRVRALGWDEVVVKPTISGGAWRTSRMRVAELASLPEGEWLVQPFLPEIVEHGELSMIFLDGEFSHAVWKRARAGDFRVQMVHGGTEHPAEPDDQLFRDARAVLAAAPSPGLYARVDGIVRGGRLLLMELEQIEPYLFLAHRPEAADRLALALARRL